MTKTSFVKQKEKRQKDSYVARLVANIRTEYQLYLMLVPMVVFFLVFHYKPLEGLQIAFKDFSVYKGINDSPFVGLLNFKTFFEGPYFKRTLINTLIISFYGLIFTFPAPIVFALLTNEIKSKWVKTGVQTVSYLPHFVSAVVVAGMVTNFLSPTNGFVNIILSKLGMEKINFLTKPEYFRTIYILMNIWKETGFSAIIYIAAIAGVDPALYEAAKIDGAGRFRQILNVTLPGIMNTVVIMFIMRVGRILSVGYETIILLYSPSVYSTADVISTFVYRTGLSEGDYSYAAAVDLFNSVIALILVAIANKVSAKFTETSLW